MDDNKGKIVIVKNMVYTDYNGKSVVDHAYKRGRPSIIISELDEYFILPLSSKIKNVDNANSFVFETIKIENNSTKNGNIYQSRAVFDNLQKIKICWYEIAGSLDKSTYLKLLYRFKSYYYIRNNHRLYSSFCEVQDDIDRQILELKIKLNN